jgi:hypothetical protein
MLNTVELSISSLLVKYRIVPAILGDTVAVMLAANVAPLTIFDGFAYVMTVACLVTINVRVIDTVDVVKLFGLLDVKIAVIV